MGQPQRPLTETTYFILLGLSPKPKHGYAIMKDVQALSDGGIILGTGTLHGALEPLFGGVGQDSIEIILQDRPVRRSLERGDAIHASGGGNGRHSSSGDGKRAGPDITVERIEVGKPAALILP